METKELKILTFIVKYIDIEDAFEELLRTKAPMSEEEKQSTLLHLSSARIELKEMLKDLGYKFFVN